MSGKKGKIIDEEYFFLSHAVNPLSGKQRERELQIHTFTQYVPTTSLSIASTFMIPSRHSEKIASSSYIYTDSFRVCIYIQTYILTHSHTFGRTKKNLCMEPLSANGSFSPTEIAFVSRGKRQRTKQTSSRTWFSLQPTTYITFSLRQSKVFYFGREEKKSSRYWICQDSPFDVTGWVLRTLYNKYIGSVWLRCNRQHGRGF